jgi:predicted O-methyltransferase YrrM
MTPMNQALWSQVDAYFSELLSGPDAVLDEVLEASLMAGLPAINISPNQGKFLNLLAQAIGARRILEIGTLGGYSGIWLARALPADGRLITLEAVPKHAAVARANFARAGLADVVDVVEGQALETLPRLAAQGEAPFDLVFIDADKPSTIGYFEWSVRLSHPGTLIIVDNVVREGEVINARSSSQAVQATRHFLEHIAGDPRVSVSAMQTVGNKGYDGFAMALVTGNATARR